MTDHYCEEHQTEFVKHKGKYGEFYSHKIEGTDEWCNEKKEKPEKEESHFKSDPEKQVSIERMNCYSGLIALMQSGVIKRDESLGKEIIGYGCQKLNLGSGIEWETLKSARPQAPQSKEKPVESKDDKQVSEFANVGAFYTACQKLNKILVKSVVDTELAKSKERYDLTKPEDRDKAYEFISAIYKKA